ncbi:MAG: hypothetical protein IJN27_00545 [Oscillospiraceae bacterium]|nr:hypothetical protein [Oscillospiraceae bacterium]
MKKIPMILLLIAPYAIYFIFDRANMDFAIGLYIYGAIIIFNMVYAFLLPKLEFNGKQLLFWNLLIKLCSIPLIVIILFVVLITSLIGGRAMIDVVLPVILIAFAGCYILQLSSAMFGISGFLWLHRHGRLTKKDVALCTAVQLIPIADVLGSVVCYFMFRKHGQTAEKAKPVFDDD